MAVLSTVDKWWRRQYHCSFIDSLVQCGLVALKASPAEKRRQKAAAAAEYKREFEKLQHQRQTGILLRHRMSMNKYNRIRKAEAQANNKTGYTRQRSHVPVNVQFDKEQALQKVQSWEQNRPINWSQLARDLGVQQGNGGQIVKSFIASQLGEQHCLKLEGRTEPSAPKARNPKERLAFGVTAPSKPSIAFLKQDIQDKIHNGTYVIGDPVLDTVIQQYTLQNGDIIQSPTTVYGRQIPLKTVRQRLADKHHKAGLIREPEFIKTMPIAQVAEVLQHGGIDVAGQTSHQLRAKLEQEATQRFLALGHDHADIAGKSWLTEVVKVVYDPIVYKTNAELKNEGIWTCDVQELVEAPMVRILALCKSSDESMLMTTAQRIADLNELGEPIEVGKTTIKDSLAYFTGDMQSRWFELGVQRGGHFKCGSGCGASLAQNTSYAQQVNRLVPSLTQLQQRATAGVVAAESGATNLQGLLVADLRREVRARNIKCNKADTMQQLLLQQLQGQQRVPALLTLNPTMIQSELRRYQIMAVEPLHDFKGHISNIMKELEDAIADGSVLRDITRTTVNMTHGRGCDWRKAVILAAAKLSGKPRNLLRSLADVSAIMYSTEEKRTPKQVLRLAIQLWRQFSLFRQIVPSPKAINKVYGGYSHNVLHSPDQLMLTSLRSANTEALERIQGQAKAITLQTSSRQPQEVARNIMLRLNEENGHDSTRRQQLEITNLSKALPAVNRTIVTVTDLATPWQTADFQALERSISMFLEKGEGVWWHMEDGLAIFHDADHDPDSRPEGPGLMSHRTATMQEVYERREEAWKAITEERVKTPSQCLLSPEQRQKTNTQPNQEDLQSYMYGGDSSGAETEEEDTAKEERPRKQRPRPPQRRLQLLSTTGPILDSTTTSSFATKLCMVLDARYKDDIIKLSGLHKRPRQPSEDVEYRRLLGKLKDAIHHRHKDLSAMVQHATETGKVLKGYLQM